MLVSLSSRFDPGILSSPVTTPQNHQEGRHVGLGKPRCQFGRQQQNDPIVAVFLSMRIFTG
jgi:hypothetical protein